MGRFGALLAVLVLLSGCSGSTRELERGMSLRTRLLQGTSCTMETEITADYGDKVHNFGIRSQSDPKGDLTFTVTQPETVSGITGKIGEEGGKLTFDDTALHFELLTDDQITPISAPWILLKTLRGGNLTSACQEDDLLHLTMEDSFEDDALVLDIWLNAKDEPVRSEILYDGRRILSLHVTSFEIL